MMKLLQLISCDQQLRMSWMAPGNFWVTAQCMPKLGKNIIYTYLDMQSTMLCMTWMLKALKTGHLQTGKEKGYVETL